MTIVLLIEKDIELLKYAIYYWALDKQEAVR